MQFNVVQIIKDRLTMCEVLERYGYEPNKKGFMYCPFHLEKTPSMKIYEKDYHCFGCGEHGDTITFVKKLFNLSFQEALKKIDIDFGLNLYGDKTFEELRKSHYQLKQLYNEKCQESINQLILMCFDKINQFKIFKNAFNVHYKKVLY